MRCRADHRLAHRQLKATGADTFMSLTTPKFSAQAIKKVAELGWKPDTVQSNVGASVGSVLKTGRFRKRTGHAHRRLRQGRRGFAVDNDEA